MDNINNITNHNEQILKQKIENRPQLKSIKKTAFNLFISIKSSPLESILHRKIVQRLYSRYVHKSNLRIYYQENYTELPIIFQHLASILPKPLNIDISFQSNFNDIQNCKYINQGIKYWYSARDISLSFKYNNFQNFKQENNNYQFFTGIKHLKSVKKLSLDFDEISIQATPMLIHMFNSVKSLKQLKQIQISFSNIQINNNNYLQELNKILGSLQNLVKIDIIYEYIQYAKEELTNCLDSLTNLKFLRDLQLHFYENELQQNQIVHLSKTIQQLNLQQLDLSFYEQEMHIETVKVLCQGLKTMLNLHKLSLSLSNTGLDREGISYLSEVLQQSANITNLEIGINNNNLKDDALQIISQQISSISQLEYLNLSFSLNDIIHGLEYLGKAFIHLKNLNTLIICANEIPKISSESIKFFSEGLKNIQKLKDLNLEFYSSNLGQKEISSLIQAISTLKCLNSVNLEIEQNQIQDEGFCQCLSLLQILDLQRLTLNVSNNNISDKCIGFLDSRPIKATRINQLDLTISQNEFTHKLIEFLKKLLYPLQNLQKLNINFQNNHKIGSEGKEQITSMIGQYPSLSEVDLSINNIGMTGEDIQIIIQDFIKYKGSISNLHFDVSFESIEEEKIQVILQQIEQMNNLDRLILITHKYDLNQNTRKLIENWVKKFKEKLIFSFIGFY